jgi:hypothetical protein
MKFKKKVDDQISEVSAAITVIKVRVARNLDVTVGTLE